MPGVRTALAELVDALRGGADRSESGTDTPESGAAA
jgi:hypothetical protein